jgi:hypothetical protein
MSVAMTFGGALIWGPRNATTTIPLVQKFQPSGNSRSAKSGVESIENKQRDPGPPSGQIRESRGLWSLVPLCLAVHTLLTRSVGRVGVHVDPPLRLHPTTVIYEGNLNRRGKKDLGV